MVETSDLPKTSEVSVSHSRMLFQSHIIDSGDPSEEDSAEAAIDCHIPALVNSTNPKLGPAIGGVDPVSYWGEGPIMGNEEYSYQYREYIFQFSNLFNRILFSFNPEHYIPAWGGFCSKGISDEYLSATFGRLVLEDLAHH